MPIVKTEKQAEFIAYIESQDDSSHWYLYLRVHGEYVRVRYENGVATSIWFSERQHLIADIATCNRIHPFYTALRISETPLSEDLLRNIVKSLTTNLIKDGGVRRAS
jgi:hypothetical protein